jgi:hypothetical protein
LAGFRAFEKSLGVAIGYESHRNPESLRRTTGKFPFSGDKNERKGFISTAKPGAQWVTFWLSAMTFAWLWIFVQAPAGAALTPYPKGEATTLIDAHLVGRIIF